MKNVLLVDDDDIFNFVNKKNIEKLGLASEIHTVANGQEAINLINEYFQKSLTVPDIILLDINMPIMDGFGFIEAFNRLPLPGIEKVKIIIVSSSDNPKDIERAQKLGVTRFLTKPISHPQLMEALA
jgi:CheY-like chemotaxis protein